jgi:flavin-dependent dehydrogenase
MIGLFQKQRMWRSHELQRTYDVVIVGAGPAGLSAAITCAEHGLSVKVLDEYMRPGGRLLGQLHQEPDGTWWNGLQEARRAVTRAEQLGVEIICGAAVYHIEPLDRGWKVCTTQKIVEAPVLLLATGAAEKPVERGVLAGAPGSAGFRRSRGSHLHAGQAGQPGTDRGRDPGRDQRHAQGSGFS